LTFDQTYRKIKVMKVMKAFKFRLKTNSTVGVKLASIAGSNRFVWNWALANQKARLEKKEYTQNYAGLCKSLVELKHDEEKVWLNNCPSQTLQQTLKNLERAIKDAFNIKSPKKFPVFKKKGLNDSFRYPQGVRVEGRKIFLPKIGLVPFFKSREIIGTIKNTTISRKGKHWFVAIQTEYEVDKPAQQSTSIVGIDVGITKFATLSDGTVYKPLNSFKKLSDTLAKAQRRLARKKKHSQNFKKQKQRINQIHTRIANARLDYLHKTSTTISKNHAAVVMEDLKVANMSKSAAGSIENPGKNVAAKSGLNKSILDQGWHTFRQFLSYKLDWLGGELIVVNPKYTSQKCGVCGYTSSENRTSQANFVCEACGYAANADINAAHNILAAGHAVLACESNCASGRKQEPLGLGNLVPACA
jgi:IS605 OrfB family transposase